MLGVNLIFINLTKYAMIVQNTIYNTERYFGKTFSWCKMVAKKKIIQELTELNIKKQENIHNINIFLTS